MSLTHSLGCLLCVVGLTASLRSNSFDCGISTHHLVRTDPHARCLDGSLGSYYVNKGFGDGANKWIIFFSGGGWCYNLKMCFERSLDHLGSSSVGSPDDRCDVLDELGGYLSGYKHASNTVSYNFNRVVVNYCDGGSFSGDTKATYGNQTLYFRYEYVYYLSP